MLCLPIIGCGLPAHIYMFFILSGAVLLGATVLRLLLMLEGEDRRPPKVTYYYYYLKSARTFSDYCLLIPGDPSRLAKLGILRMGLIGVFGS